VATRFYLTSSGAAAVNPAFAGWTNTTGADRLKCVTARISSAFTTKTYSIEDTGAPFNDLSRQYVSDPINAGDITGTVKGILAAAEGVTQMTTYPQIVIRVVSNDGSTFRGTLIDFNNAAVSNEYAISTTVWTSRKFPRNWSGSGTTVTTVTAQANDRIVIDIGFRQDVNGEGSGVVGHRYGDNNGSDKAEDETGTTDLNAWIEFSQDLFGSVVDTLKTPAQVDAIATGQAPALFTSLTYAPDGDVSAGNWTPSTGGTLWGTIDEGNPSDADYDVNINAAGGFFEVSLPNPPDPSMSSGHYVNYRIEGGTGSMVVSLRQGAGTQIASWTHDPAPSVPTTFSQVLSAAETDAITDYTDLRLRFNAIP